MTCQKAADTLFKSKLCYGAGTNHKKASDYTTDNHVVLSRSTRKDLKISYVSKGQVPCLAGSRMQGYRKALMR